MALTVGIVGLPNVGKSTLFNSLTGGGAESANYPFCTIDRNVGVAPVRDPRVEKLAAVVRPQKAQQATVDFVDIAGLVRGASRGEGLGNQFLAHIREVDLVLEMVRCFEDPDVTHVDGSVDPVRDVEVIEAELLLEDLETVEKRIARDEKALKGQDPEARKRLELSRRLVEYLGQGTPVREIDLEESARELLRDYHLLSAKPRFFCANVSEDEVADGNAHSRALEELAARKGCPSLRIAARIEEEIAQLGDEERSEFLAELGLEQSGLDRVVHTAYHLLGLQTFFTCNANEVRAWTIPRGATAPEAAGVVHSDFQKGFIRAQTLSYTDWERCGSWSAARDAGVLRTEGKDYVVQEGDILQILHSS